MDGYGHGKRHVRAEGTEVEGGGHVHPTARIYPYKAIQGIVCVRRPLHGHPVLAQPCGHVHIATPRGHDLSWPDPEPKAGKTGGLSAIFRGGRLFHTKKA